MAHIVNPYNLDDDDDAIFSAAISMGLIWIVDDEDDNGYSIADLPPLPIGMRPHTPYIPTKHESTEKSKNYKAIDVFQAARDFIDTRNEEWVNFDRLSHHLHERFDNLNSAKLGQTGKKNNLFKFFGDYSAYFELRLDEEKQGLRWIRLKPKERK